MAWTVARRHFGQTKRLVRLPVIEQCSFGHLRSGFAVATTPSLEHRGLESRFVLAVHYSEMPEGQDVPRQRPVPPRTGLRLRSSSAQMVRRLTDVGARRSAEGVVRGRLEELSALASSQAADGSPG